MTKWECITEYQRHVLIYITIQDPVHKWFLSPDYVTSAPSQKTICPNEKSSAVLPAFVTSHMGGGGLTFLFQQFM